jgi:dihydrofolate reductase
MGKIIVSEFITLDGVIGAPGGEDSLGERSGWSIPYFSEETAKFKLDDLLASDALLMGRATYQIHAAAWPSMTDEEGFADRMNSLPKYVVSTTLEKVEWNDSRLIRGNIPEAVKKLKQEIQRDILIDGSGELVNLLMQHDLIDEYRLLVHPVVVGKGKRLFREDSQKKELRLIEARAFGTGVVALTYQPTETRSE